MESGIEARIRELLANAIGKFGRVEPHRLELNGVTIVEVRVERLVVVVDQPENPA